MKKIRYYVAVIALAAALSGPAIALWGAGSIANAASSHHVSSTFAAGHTKGSIAIMRYGPCPVLGTDC